MLLDRFLGGDESAFTELMRRHEDRIFSLTLRITGDRGDALEATQETFLSMWMKASTFRGKSRFGTWLYRIGINAARDQLRRRSRAPLLDDPSSAETSAPGAGPESAIARIDVARALAALPHEYREAVIMHDLGAVPYEEIAAATGVALGTVKSRISRGRRLLAQQLELGEQDETSKDPI